MRTPVAMLCAVLALLGLPLVLGGCDVPVWGEPDDDDDSTDPFGPDDDDTTSDDDDTTIDDDDVSAGITLLAGRWEFTSGPQVDSNACGLSPSPHAGLDTFEVFPISAELYDVEVDAQGLTFDGCQVVDNDLFCPVEDEPWEPMSSDNVAVEARHVFRGAASAEDTMTVEMTLTLDCEGAGCDAAASAASLTFPCEATASGSAAFLEVVIPGDDDDVGPDDDDTTSDPGGPPDIEPVSIDGTTLPATVAAGSTLTLGYSYTNAGTGAAPLSADAPLSNLIHLSTSGDADGSVAILVAGTRSTDLGAGVSSFLSPDAVVIAAPAGVYQLILQVDALGNVDEDDEGDNILVAGEVTVTPSGDPEGDCTDGVDDDFDGLVDCADDDCAGIPYCDPDIVGVEVTGTSLPTVVSQGGTVSLGYGYANMGGGTTTGLSPGQPMVNHVLLSSSTSLLDAVQTLRVGERTSDIDAGDDGFLSPIDVTVSVSAGTYQVLLNVDVTDVVDEGDESNNVLVAGSLTVTAL